MANTHTHKRTQKNKLTRLKTGRVVLSDATLHLFVCSTERSRARASKKCMSSEITCLQWQQIGKWRSAVAIDARLGQGCICFGHTYTCIHVLARTLIYAGDTSICTDMRLGAINWDECLARWTSNSSSVWFLFYFSHIFCFNYSALALHLFVHSRWAVVNVPDKYFWHPDRIVWL